MKRRWMIPLCLALLAGAGPGASAEEYWLKYRFSPTLDREIVNRNDTRVDLTAKLPEGWVAPEGAIDPLVGTLKLAGGGKGNRIRVLFARTRADGPRDKMWIGHDHADWSKAQTVGPVARDTNWYKGQAFDIVRLQLQTREGPVDYHVAPTLVDYNDKRPMAAFKSACCYEDRIVLEGKERRVALVDYNSNGLFNDCGANEYECDWLMIDMNDDGKLDAYGPDYKEAFTVGKYVKFGEKLHALTVAPDGAFFALEPATCPMGKIRPKTDQKEFKAVFFGENGRLVVAAKDGAAEVPAGTYKLVRADFTEPGANEQEAWKLSGSSRDKATTVTIAAGQTAELAFGPPLTAKLQIEGQGPEKSVNLKLVGQAGEEYSVTQGYRNPENARLKVELEGSKAEAKYYDFAYG